MYELHWIHHYQTFLCCGCSPSAHSTGRYSRLLPPVIAERCSYPPPLTMRMILLRHPKIALFEMLVCQFESVALALFLPWFQICKCMEDEWRFLIISFFRVLDKLLQTSKRRLLLCMNNRLSRQFMIIHNWSAAVCSYSAEDEDGWKIGVWCRWKSSKGESLFFVRNCSVSYHSW